MRNPFRRRNPAPAAQPDYVQTFNKEGKPSGIRRAKETKMNVPVTHENLSTGRIAMSNLLSQLGGDDPDVRTRTINAAASVGVNMGQSLNHAEGVLKQISAMYEARRLMERAGQKQEAETIQYVTILILAGCFVALSTIETALATQADEGKPQ